MFVPNPELAKELEAQAGHTAPLKRAARVVARKAEALAHHAMPRPGARRMAVVEEKGEVRLVNTNYGAHLEEWGSVNNPPYAPLRRSVRAAGLPLKESPLQGG